jgi:hypothetical protein
MDADDATRWGSIGAFVGGLLLSLWSLIQRGPRRWRGFGGEAARRRWLVSLTADSVITERLNEAQKIARADRALLLAATNGGKLVQPFSPVFVRIITQSWSGAGNAREFWGEAEEADQSYRDLLADLLRHERVFVSRSDLTVGSMLLRTYEAEGIRHSMVNLVHVWPDLTLYSSFNYLGARPELTNAEHARLQTMLRELGNLWRA